MSAGLADGVKLQKVSVTEQVFPTKIGRLAADLTVSEWLDYGNHGQRQDCNWRLIFDCWEPDVGDHCPPPDGDGYDGEPVGGGTCGQGEPDDCDSSRWYLEAAYCNMYITNDMEFDPAYGGEYAQRIELAWYWYVNGAGTGENMALAVEFFEDFDDTCATGDPNGQGEYLGGIVLMFGYAKGDPGAYFITDLKLCGLDCLPTPADGKGSYNIWILTYDDPNDPEFRLATCGHVPLWGTGDGEQPIPDDVGRGRMSHQGPIQWDDDYPTDGWHTAPDECYDYSYGLCPDPLGAMFCFWVAVECPGDVDGDDDVDQADLGALLTAWDSHWDDPTWDSRPDLDFNGRVDQSDLGILLADWGCGT